MDRKALNALKTKRYRAKLHREYGPNGTKTKALEDKQKSCE